MIDYIRQAGIEVNIRIAMLFMALVPFIAFTSPFNAAPVTSQVLIPFDIDASSSGSCTPDIRALESDDSRGIRELFIVNLSYCDTQPIYWISPAGNQKQAGGFNQTGFKLKIVSSCFDLTPQSGQFKLAVRELVPGDVASLSPHNCILRL